MAKGKEFTMIDEYKEKLYLEKLYKKNTIDLDNYFKYSGKLEIGKRFKEVTEEYTYQVRCYIKNDMSKYKLKDSKMETDRFLNNVIELLDVMSSELKEKEEKCADGRMLIRIGHRISAIHKVKHYIKQRIKKEDIPEVIRKKTNVDFLYNLKRKD